MGYGMERVGTSLSASRRGFLVGTILVFVATFVWILLAGARAVPEWMEYFVLADPGASRPDSPTGTGTLSISTVAVLVCVSHCGVRLRPHDQVSLDAGARHRCGSRTGSRAAPGGWGPLVLYHGRSGYAPSDHSKPAVMSASQ